MLDEDEDEDARSAVKLKRERVDLKGEMRPVGD